MFQLFATFGVVALFTFWWVRASLPGKLCGCTVLHMCVWCHSYLSIYFKCYFWCVNMDMWHACLCLTPQHARENLHSNSSRPLLTGLVSILDRSGNKALNCRILKILTTQSDRLADSQSQILTWFLLLHFQSLFLHLLLHPGLLWRYQVTSHTSLITLHAWHEITGLGLGLVQPVYLYLVLFQATVSLELHSAHHLCEYYMCTVGYVGHLSSELFIHSRFHLLSSSLPLTIPFLFSCLTTLCIFVCLHAYALSTPRLSAWLACLALFPGK